MKNWLFLPLIMLTTVASAQHAGVFLSQAWSDNLEMQNPLGWGLFVSTSPTAVFVIGMSFERFANERTYDGYSSVFTPNPVWEPIRSSSRAIMLKGHLSYHPLKYTHFSFGIGSAVSTNWFNATKRGVQTNNHVPTEDGHKFGIALSVLARITPVESLPLTINVDAQRHFLGESTSTVTEAQMPFKKSMELTSLSIGVGYVF